MDGLVGEKGLYPSRSELVRVACRDFLIRELDAVKSFNEFEKRSITQTPPKTDSNDTIPTLEIDPNLFVQIPLGSASNGIPEYKTFRLVKK